MKVAPPGPLSVSERLVFLHIAKCAGTSVDRVLRANFKDDEICPAKHDILHRHDSTGWRKYRYFSGHFSKLSIDAIPGPKRVVTVLRDPRDRILSLYYFWRSHTEPVVTRGNLAGPRLARDLSIDDFLKAKSSAVTVSIRNHMVRLLLGQLTPEVPAGFHINVRDFAVETALLFLKRFYFVGFVDTLEDDLRDLCRGLGFPPPSEVPHINAYAGRESSENFEAVELQPHTEAVLKELDRLTNLDRALYERALTLRFTLRCPFPM